MAPWAGAGRAGDQEVSNPLSRQAAGLLRPHPRQKRVSWGTTRLARSALPDRNESKWPVVALESKLGHSSPSDKEIIGDPI